MSTAPAKFRAFHSLQLAARDLEHMADLCGHRWLSLGKMEENLQKGSMKVPGFGGGFLAFRLCGPFLDVRRQAESRSMANSICA